MIFFLIIIMAIPFVNAGSIGITPTGSKFFFEPGLEKTFKYTVSSIDSEYGVDIYVNGDLANYTELSNNHFSGTGEFEVKIKLPAKIDVPGNHRLLIGAIESSREGSGIGGLAAIQIPIDIFVPYPGQYAEATFELENVNIGENARYELRINNLGNEDITAFGNIDIYNGKEKIRKLKTKVISAGKIKNQEEFIETGFLNVSDLSQGIYIVVAAIDYGKKIEIEKELKIGYFFVNITDYSYIFEANKINKFNIEVENLWNSQMENVYGDVVITNNGAIVDSFKTPSKDMSPWEKVNLTGFFDATNVTEGKYTASLIVNYENKSTNKLVAIYTKNPPKNPIWDTIRYAGIGVAVVMAIFITIIIYLIVKIRRIGKNAKKKKR